MWKGIIKKPIITEQSMAEVAKGHYTFAVDEKATKGAIKKAVEEQFSVHVGRVLTSVMKGKRYKSGKRRLARERTAWKKAVVHVGKDEKISIFEVSTG